jgi:glycosyltransferase involved in cell wall biosynthesis
MAPLVSVVTPVYNGERHLCECIESVLAQTYERWSYVIVDNCSTDGTAEIARSYARADARVRYERHDEFVEVIQSFNRAVRATDPGAAYCKVLGADDWLEPRSLERMVAVAQDNPSAGAIGAWRVRGGQIDLDDLPSTRSVFAGREILHDSLLRRISVLGSPTSLLMRADLVRAREPFYDPRLRHADTEAIYWLLERSDFGAVHEALTSTRISEAGQASLSDRLNSLQAERLWRLLHYGPGVLTLEEFRPQVRYELRLYLRWQLKQRLRPSLLRDREFHRYQRRLMAMITSEPAADREVHGTLALLRGLRV